MKTMSKEKECLKMSEFYKTTKLMTIKDLAEEYVHSPYNRNLNSSHVNKLKKSIDKIGMMINITVNDSTKHIVDGNHRTEAIFQLVQDEKLDENFKILVNIVDMSDDIERQIIQEIQHSSKHWTGHDHINMQYNIGNEHYKRLVDFAMSHNLTHKGDKIIPRYAVSLIKRSSKNANVNKGDFTCTDEELAKAHIIHNEIEEMLNIFDMKCTAFTEPMISQWHDFREKTQKVTGKYNFKDWASVMKKKKNINMVSKSQKNNQEDWKKIFNELFIQVISK